MWLCFSAGLLGVPELCSSLGCYRNSCVQEDHSVAFTFFKRLCQNDTCQ